MLRALEPGSANVAWGVAVLLAVSAVTLSVAVAVYDGDQKTDRSPLTLFKSVVGWFAAPVNNAGRTITTDPAITASIMIGRSLNKSASSNPSPRRGR